jgi:hypothetical protein
MPEDKLRAVRRSVRYDGGCGFYLSSERLVVVNAVDSGVGLLRLQEKYSRLRSKPF